MFHNPKIESGSQDLQHNMHNVFLPKMPSEQLSQLSNQSFGLGRQVRLLPQILKNRVIYRPNVFLCAGGIVIATENTPMTHRSLACSEKHGPIGPAPWSLIVPLALMSTASYWDSLSFCATLQDGDRSRPENIMDFMEREMNLDEYIGALQDLDVPADHIDLDDTELQKTHLIYDNEHDNYDPYAHRPDLQARIQVPQQHCGSSDRSLASTPSNSFVQIKTEDELDWEYEPTTSTSTAPPRRRLARDSNDNYTPKTKARKYVLKPEEEKKNPAYKLKRARNNDAVRKSRSKQKELQVARDRELEMLRQENIQLKAELNLAQRLNEEQKNTIARMARR